MRLAKRPANPFDKPPEARGDLLGCDGGGIAAVERLHEPVALDLDGAANHGERPEVLVLARDADAAAVGVGEQLLVKLEEGALVGRAQIVGQQVVHDKADGVHARLGQRGVRALARRGDAGTALAVGDDGKALGGGQTGGVGPHHGLGDAGHRVRGSTARERDHHALGLGNGLAGKRTAVAPLFAVTHGELGVGGEQEGRVVVALAVIGHVGHASLLVRAEQEAQRVGETRRFSRVLHVLPELHGVQGHHAGTFVVDHAAADEVAVLAGDVVGLERPAGAGGHHIHMADDAKLRVRFTGKVGVADVAVHIVRLKAHVSSHVERRRKRLARAGAERRALGCLVQLLEAGNAHEGGDVLHHGVPMGLKISVDFLRELFVLHRCLPVLGYACVSAYYAPSGTDAPDGRKHVAGLSGKRAFGSRGRVSRAHRRVRKG